MVRAIHVAAGVSTSFLFLAEYSSIVGTCRVGLSVSQLMDIWVVSTSAVMNKAVLNIREQVFVFVQNKNSEYLFPIILATYLGVELLSHTVILHVRF